MKFKFFIILSVLLACFFTFNEVFAYRAVFETHITVNPFKIDFIGNSSGGQFGAVFSSGDFNGDSIDDLFIGSPFASTGGKQWNGTVGVYFGGFNSSSPDIVYHGKSSGEQLGTSIVIGDFNNDGLDDAAMGAYNAYNKGLRTGKVYLMYGKPLIDLNVIDFAIDRPNFVLYGKNHGDNFGLALEKGDINNDGIDDLFIGAPNASSSNTSNSGLVYVYFGLDKKFATDKRSDIVLLGQNKGEKFGSIIKIGDIDGDNKTDIVVGAFMANKVYYYNRAGEFPPQIKFPTKILQDGFDKDWFGFSLDIGDINNDSLDDLAISSFPYLGDKSNSKINIYLGGDDLSNIPDSVISDPLNESLLASSVLLEDINGDNNAEIIIGAPGASLAKSADAGDVYIIDTKFGLLPFYSIQDKKITTLINGENPDDWFGYSLEVLDFDNDGIHDLAISARYFDGPDSINNGKVYILSGKYYPFGAMKFVYDLSDEEITRGEFIKIVLESLDIKIKKADEINNCYEYKEFCLFNFMAISSYDGIQLEPDLLLFPDVKPGDEYYEDIVVAAILNLVNGYINEKNSPFRPDLPITRIQALKIIFGAADLVPPKYKFELIAMLGSSADLINQPTYFVDIDSKIPEMWWYPRYVNFAVENNIVDSGEYFRPNDNITSKELDEIITRTLDYLNSKNEEINS